MIYLSAGELISRDGDILPVGSDGQPDMGKIDAALKDASGVVCAYIPSLIGEDGERLPPPPRLADSLKPVCRDLAVYYLTRFNGAEDAGKRYQGAIGLLKELGRQPDGKIAPADSGNAGGAVLIDEPSSHFGRKNGR